VLAWSALLNAQTAPPKYDPHTETKMKGTVDEVKVPPKENGKDVVHLMIKSGDEVVDLYFCPKSFMDDMGVSFSKGDEVAVTGSKVKYRRRGLDSRAGSRERLRHAGAARRQRQSGVELEALGGRAFVSAARF
jgi:hypothetical protein